MTVLITGAGLVGAHGAKAFVERGERTVIYDIAPSVDYLASIVDLDQVTVVAGDLLDLPRLFDTFREFDVKRVVHTASLIGNRVQANPYWGIQVMVNGSVNVLEAARLAGVKRVVFVSSQSVYQVLPGSVPLREGEVPLGGGGFYAACKISVEYLGECYHRCFGMDFIVLRPTPVYGYGRFAGGSYTGQLIHRVVSAAALGHRLQMPRHATGVIEWIHASDVAQACVLASFSDRVKYGVYNVGTGVTHDFPALVDVVRCVVPTAQIELTDEPPSADIAGGPPSRTQPMDLSHIRADLGFQPRYSFEDGLREYVATVRGASAQLVDAR